jgi:predicted DNA-binding ArsR family transcriptional regulator
MRLRNGKAYVGLVNSSWAIPSNGPKMEREASCFYVDVTTLEFKGKVVTGLYPVVSAFTSTRHHEIAARIENIVSNYKQWINLKISLKIHDIFLIILDADIMKSYENLFNLLMKVGILL